jgi:hypothetical protein
VLRFFKYFYDIVSQGSDLELKKKKRVEGSLASSMDGLQIDKRSTLPESNKRNEEKKAIVVGGERERKEKEEKKKHEEIYLCNLRERERERELASY